MEEEKEEEEEEEEKKKNDEEEKMEGKRRDEKDMLDRLVVEEGMIIKFFLVPFVTSLLPLQLLLQGLNIKKKVTTNLDPAS